MYDDDRAAPVDLTDVHSVEELVRRTAIEICAEQPDMDEPKSLADMDSFSVVQMLLEIENVTGRKLLEKFEDFSYGEEFADLAAHIVHIVTWEDAHPDWDPTSDEEYHPQTPEEKPEKAAAE
jgi:acyl carrier protein